MYDGWGRRESESLGVSWNLNSVEATRDLLTRNNRIAGISDTTWEAIQGQLALGDRNGDTIDQLAKRVQGVFAQASGYRSRMIARTETIGAANAGALNAAVSSDLVEKKTWLSTIDARTRATHVTADGQTVPIDKKFQVGASSMNAPGDPAGGPHETINCRCTLLFVRASTLEAGDEEDDSTPTSGEIQALQKEAARIRAIKDPGERFAARRKFGKSLREEAEARARNVDPAKKAALLAEQERAAKATNEALHAVWDVQRDKFDDLAAYNRAFKAAEKKHAALKAVWDKANVAVVKAENARGQAVRGLLAEIREMGIDVKDINFETGSAVKGGKTLLGEVADWFPRDWWDRSNALNPIQSKLDSGARARGGYNHAMIEKRDGLRRMISRITTTGKESNAVHELGHRMEYAIDGIKSEEMRFWRERTEDGTGLRKYKFGRADEVVAEDQFGDEYMGKSYLGARGGIEPIRDSAGRVTGTKYSKESLDATLEAIEASAAPDQGMARQVAWEVFSMGMEELYGNRFGSWDRDPDYIDFMLGLLGSA